MGFYGGLDSSQLRVGLYSFKISIGLSPSSTSSYHFFLVVGFLNLLNISVYYKSKIIINIVLNIMFGKIKPHTKPQQTQAKTIALSTSPQSSLRQKIKAPITHRIHKQPKPPNRPPNKPPKLTHSHNTLRQSLKGSQFRLLNQILYTQDSQKAVQYFNQNPQYCNTYHEGFREQTTGWEVNPLDLIITMLLNYGTRLEKKKIIDLGCGEGRLQQSIEHTGCRIRSFDIMQLKPFIIKADIAHLKLKSETQDIAVFCLSLMGVNYIEFLLEALRVLKIGGEMFVAEVESRCKEWGRFEEMLGALGCRMKELRREKYFRLMVFEKVERSGLGKESRYKGVQLAEYAREVLGPCIYKRR